MVQIQRGVLALRMKPIIEARAKEQQLRKPESVSPISDEQTPDIFTGEVQPHQLRRQIQRGVF
jgi:hypothetical protein